MGRLQRARPSVSDQPVAPTPPSLAWDSSMTTAHTVLASNESLHLHPGVPGIWAVGPFPPAQTSLFGSLSRFGSFFSPGPLPPPPARCPPQDSFPSPAPAYSLPLLCCRPLFSEAAVLKSCRLQGCSQSGPTSLCSGLIFPHILDPRGVGGLPPGHGPQAWELPPGPLELWARPWDGQGVKALGRHREVCSAPAWGTWSGCVIGNGNGTA